MRRALLLAGLVLAGCGSAEQAAPAAPAVVWAVGDLDAREPAAEQVVATIARDDPDRVIYTGDVYETGTAEEFRDNFDAVYGPLKKRTWPTPGNHEWDNRETGYFPYWRVKSHYHRRIAGWDVLSLNTQEAMRPQARWVRTRRTGRCVLAFWHRPRYNAGTVHGDQPDVAPLWRAVRRRAELVISGHEHNLQRLRPVDGVTQFVSGAGGRELHGVDEAYPRLAFAAAEFGALRLELRRTHARFRFVAADGRVLDRGRVACRR